VSQVNLLVLLTLYLFEAAILHLMQLFIYNAHLLVQDGPLKVAHWNYLLGGGSLTQLTSQFVPFFELCATRI
jgi:hypothetical protein